jgi:hypothetical protein
LTPGAVISQKAAQQEEDHRADNRSFQAVDAANDHYEDHVGGPIENREAGGRGDAEFLQNDKPADKAGESRRNDIDQKFDAAFD